MGWDEYFVSMDVVGLLGIILYSDGRASDEIPTKFKYFGGPALMRAGFSSYLVAYHASVLD